MKSFYYEITDGGNAPFFTSTATSSLMNVSGVVFTGTPVKGGFTFPITTASLGANLYDAFIEEDGKTSAVGNIRVYEGTGAVPVPPNFPPYSGADEGKHLAVLNGVLDWDAAGTGGGGSYDDTKVKADIQTNKTDIVNLENQVNALDAQVLDNTTDINAQDNRITSLENAGGGGSYDDTQVKADISQNASDITALTTRVTNAEGQVINNEVEITTKWGMWSGNQAAYDALGTYDNDTLYVVV